MELENELIKFASANNLSKGSRLVELVEDEIEEYLAIIGVNTLVSKYLLGVDKYHDSEGNAVCRTNGIKLLDKPYKGGTFARSFDCSGLSHSLEPYSSLMGYGHGMQTMTVMMHPHGYTQNAECNYFIGNTINLLNSEGATTGELIYFAYKLGTGLSSEQLAKREVNKEHIKHVLDSVLGPWFTMISLEKSGFCDYGSPRGMYISHFIMDKISEFNLEDIKCFSDLISIKEENSVWNSLERFRERDSELCEIFEKFMSKSKKLSGRYGCEESYLFKLLKEIIANKDLKEIKSLASDIRKRDIRKRDKEFNGEYRPARCGKPTRVKGKTMDLF